MPAQQFQRVGRNSQHQIRVERRHHMEACELRAAFGLFARGLEILAVLDQFGAKTFHRAVLLDRIAARHVDHRRHAVPARRKREALAMIAARGRNNARRVRPLALQPLEIDQAAAHLEGSDGRVVLMLDDDRRTEPFGQERPGMRRRRRHRRVDDLQRPFEFPAIEHRLPLTPTPCRRQRRMRSRRRLPAPAAASHCAPCPTESSGNSFPSPPRGNRTAPGASPKSSP